MKEKRIAKHRSFWPHSIIFSSYLYINIIKWAWSQKMSILMYVSMHMQAQHLLDTCQGRAGGHKSAEHESENVF